MPVNWLKGAASLFGTPEAPSQDENLPNTRKEVATTAPGLGGFHFPALVTPPPPQAVPVAFPQTAASSQEPLSTEDQGFYEQEVKGLGADARVTASAGYNTFLAMLSRARERDPRVGASIIAAAANFSQAELVAEMSAFDSNLTTAYQQRLSNVQVQSESKIAQIRSEAEELNSRAQGLDQQTQELQRRIDDLRGKSQQARLQAGERQIAVNREQTTLNRRKTLVNMAYRQVANDLATEKAQLS